jgi:hypothetical protein
MWEAFILSLIAGGVAFCVVGIWHIGTTVDDIHRKLFEEDE